METKIAYSNFKYRFNATKENKGCFQGPTNHEKLSIVNARKRFENKSLLRLLLLLIGKKKLCKDLL